MKLWFWMQHHKHRAAFRARKVTRTFEKQAPGTVKTYNNYYLIRNIILFFTCNCMIEVQANAIRKKLITQHLLPCLLGDLKNCRYKTISNKRYIIRHEQTINSESRGIPSCRLIRWIAKFPVKFQWSECQTDAFMRVGIFWGIQTIWRLV